MVFKLWYVTYMSTELIISLSLLALRQRSISLNPQDYINNNKSLFG